MFKGTLVFGLHYAVFISDLSASMIFISICRNPKRQQVLKKVSTSARIMSR